MVIVIYMQTTVVAHQFNSFHDSCQRIHSVFNLVATRIMNQIL